MNKKQQKEPSILYCLAQFYRNMELHRNTLECRDRCFYKTTDEALRDCFPPFQEGRYEYVMGMVYKLTGISLINNPTGKDSPPIYFRNKSEGKALETGHLPSSSQTGHDSDLSHKP